jgi:hypothetical protein
VAERPAAVTEPVYGSVDWYVHIIREFTADEDQVFNVAFGMIDALTDCPIPVAEFRARTENIVAAGKRVYRELLRARLEVAAHG